MVIARLTDGTLILGLSRENLRRLELLQPISISKASHGVDLPESIPRIGIIFGETEAAISEALDAAYAVKP